MNFIVQNPWLWLVGTLAFSCLASMNHIRRVRELGKNISRDMSFEATGSNSLKGMEWFIIFTLIASGSGIVGYD